ncbi:MAG: hypothetical protein K0R07_74 [Sedimentibacter sp.]|nr:hypothetical protein [Sedimentibacter sp.]
MFKKALRWYIVTFVVVTYLVVVAIGYNNDWATRRIEYAGLSISGWDYELSEIDSDKIKFTYKLTLANNDKQIDFIKSIKPGYKMEVENIIDYDKSILVNTDIKPDEEKEISWDIIVNTRDLKSVEIKEISGFLTNIEVSVGNNTSYSFFINN